jgi:hypothetical protein
MEEIETALLALEVIPSNLYTAPPQREWVGLTDEEIEKIVYNIKSVTMGIVTTEYLARAIEAKLKEKNT